MKAKKSQQRNKFSFSKGFSFIEVMLGCILFTVGTLSLYTVYTSGEKARFFASQKIRALYLAKGQIARFEAAGYQAIQSFQNVTLKDFEDFSLNSNVEAMRADKGLDEIGKAVTVTAFYDLQGERQEVSLQTQFYK